VAGRTGITGVARVDLRVDDLPAALDFYERVVGLEALDGGEVDGVAADAVLRAPGGPPLLALRHEGVSEKAPRRASGLFHTAFRYPTRADLAAALRRIAGTRAHFSGASDHGVSEALYLDDPAGNGVELYWDRPQEVWPDDMYTLPLDLEELATAGGEAAAAPEGTDVGHVHLKASDLIASQDFYVADLGLEVMHRYGDQASFLAVDGYHHHVGLNVWYSLGADAPPSHAAGLDRVVFAAEGEERRLRDPDGIEIVLSPPRRS
jgi:catechol 2,3-dioxygenase